MKYATKLQPQTKLVTYIFIVLMYFKPPKKPSVSCRTSYYAETNKHLFSSTRGRGLGAPACLQQAERSLTARLLLASLAMEGGGRVSWMKYGPAVSLVMVLLALWFRSPQNDVLDDRLDTVLSSLLRAERKVGVNGVAKPRVAVGECKCCKLTKPAGQCSLSVLN